MEELQAQIAALTAFIASLRTSLGLPADADELAVATKVSELISYTNDLDAAAEEAEAAKAEAEAAKAKLAETGKENVVLSERLDASDERLTRLSTEVETLRTEKNVREAEAIITLAMKDRKLTPAEVEGDDAPMRQLAMTNRPMFAAIIAKRTAGNLTLAISTDGDAEAADVDPNEFWNLVRAKRTADDKLSSQDAQDLVLADRPEFKALFKAAEIRLASERAQGRVSVQ